MTYIRFKAGDDVTVVTPSYRDNVDKHTQRAMDYVVAMRAARGNDYTPPVVGPAGPVSAADAKRAFTARHLDDLTARFLAVLNSHPRLFALPEVDRANAARCAATHALLAVRSGSVALVGDP